MVNNGLFGDAQTIILVAIKRSGLARYIELTHILVLTRAEVMQEILELKKKQAKGK